MSLVDSLHIPGGFGVEGSSLGGNFPGQEGKKSRNKFSGHSAGPTGSEMGKAVAHAGCPGVHAGKAMRGEAGVSEGEKRGGKLVS